MSPGRLSGDSPIARILFIRTDRLGETLLNLPAVAALRAALPEASVTLLVDPDLQPLMERLPGIDRVLASHAPGRSWLIRALRLGRTLKAGRFDLAVVSNPKKELHLAVWLAGIPYRVGYGRKWGWLLTHRLGARQGLGERHEVEYNLDLVRTLGLPTSSVPCQMPRFESEQAEVLQLLEEQGVKASEPFLAVHPWASNPIKQWPLDRFQALIRRAVEELKIHVVVIGASMEQEQVTSLLPSGVSVVNLVGRLTLTQLAALLQRARLLISNDSGPVHLAAAVGTPTVVVFGTTDPAASPLRWGPWGAGHTVIWKPAMEAITVEEVLQAVQRHLPADMPCVR